MKRNAADGALQFFIPRRKAGLFTKPFSLDRQSGWCLNPYSCLLVLAIY
ncbi:MAG: hypothetical protein OS130_08550 [Thermodesulfobacteriota bacterium]|jgi:hypothetical protein|nr:MAG: hypothetical protein OS130_08550 [Thermodesulfobacteriota bacterium]